MESATGAASLNTTGPLLVEPAGQLPWQWGTTFLLANLFSFYWLIKAFINAQPSIAYRLSKVSSALKLGAQSNSSSPTTSRCSSSSSLHVQGTKARRVSDDASHQQLAPVLFEWHNMGCSVNTATGNKTLLQDIWGSAKPGQLHGLMGPSGAGKSTLLDLLTMRLNDDNCTGQLLINKHPITQRQLANSSVYVPQRDSLVPVMTARESVQFAAAIKLPQSIAKAHRERRVDLVLELMGLAEQQDMLVGGTLPGGLVLPGMSGSERKQLHIACGVVAGASLVFLDEPTTGLDACSALNIMLFLKGMATQQGATLLASIHQPRSVIWSQLDQVTLLASGRLMYTGPTEDLVPWFNSLGYPYNPEVQGMTPDWALDLVSLGFDKHSPHQHIQSACMDAENSGPAIRSCVTASDVACCADTVSSEGSNSSLPATRTMQHAHVSGDGDLMTTPEQLVAAAVAFRLHLQKQQPELFEAAASQKRAAAEAEAGDGIAGAADGSDDDRCSSSDGVSAGASAYGKYKALLWREVLVTTRNPLDFGGRVLVFAYLGLLWGLVTYDLPGDASSIFYRMVVSYMTVVLFYLLPFVSMGLFSADKGLFVEDIAGRMYHPLQYFMAKLTVSLPYNAALAAVLQLIFYGLAGMRSGAGVIVQSTLLSVLIGLVAMQAVYFCAVFASSQDLAFVMAIIWICPNLLVNPFMQPLQNFSLGWGLTWMRYLSPGGFAWQGLMQLEMAGRGFDCSTDPGLRAIGFMKELIPETNPILRIMKARLNNLGPDCIASGDAIIEWYSAEQMPYVATVFILLGYFAIFLALTYFAIWRLGKRKA